ncbi:PAS domain-containing protein (plasmid) [Rhizobium leguminosarum]|nr:PAS domain-containing protein [Rhizobium leguminosarum]
MIEFDLSGRILTANENFCRALGYELREIVGKHHSMFVEPAYASSTEYKAFWTKLAAGKFDQQQYKRVGKGGREVWIEASYNPVFRRGKPVKVIKIATDITAQKLRSAEDRARSTHCPGLRRSSNSRRPAKS